MKLLSSNIKKLQETETLKELLIFREMEPFSPSPENLSFFKKFLYFLKGKLFLYFTFIFQETTFLCFRKGIFRSLAYLELEAYLESSHI